MPSPASVTITVNYDDGSTSTGHLPLTGPHAPAAITVQIDEGRDLTAVVIHRDAIRTYDPSTQPVALDDQDPGNTDPDQMTAPLDADDDIYGTVFQDTK